MKTSKRIRIQGDDFLGVLDVLKIKDNAVLALPPYKRVTSYVGNKLLLERADNAQLMITTKDYDNNGDIKQSVVTNFASGQDVVVKEIYLETGGVKAYQSLYERCPLIAIAGVFLVDGLFFDGLNDYMEIDIYSAINIINPPLSIYTNVKSTNLNSNYIISKLSSNVYSDLQFCSYFNTRTFLVLNGNNTYTGNHNIIGNQKTISTWNSGTENTKINVNNTYFTTSTQNITLSNKSRLFVGTRWETATGLFGGNIKSILVFNSDVYSKYNDLVNAGV